MSRHAGRFVRTVLCVALVALASLAGACAPAAPPPSTGQPTVGSVRAVADQVVSAIKAQDGAALSGLVHPEKGVRFSPYAFVDTKSDVVLTPAEVATFWDSTKTYTWGKADGTGDPLKLTPPEYSARYILDRDFSAATTVSENNDRATGNTVNNAATVYPEGTRVEYYIEATTVGGQPANDWKALRLVFEKVGDTWYLVGVIHDEWTI